MTPIVALGVLAVTLMLSFIYLEWRSRGASKTRSALVVLCLLIGTLTNIVNPGLSGLGLGMLIGMLGMLLLPAPRAYDQGQVRS